MKKKKEIKQVFQKIDKNGRIRLTDERGVFISKKDFIKTYVDKNEQPENLISGELTTLYKKEIAKPFIVKFGNKKAPKEVSEYLEVIAKENFTTVRKLVTDNPEILEIAKKSSYDFSLSVKAKEKRDGNISVRFDKRQMFDKIKSRTGKIFIGKIEYTKDEAIKYFLKQTLLDIAEITEDNNGAIPYFVSYDGKYNAATNELFLPNSYTDFVIDTKPKNKNVKKGKKSTKKVSAKPNQRNRNKQRTKK